MHYLTLQITVFLLTAIISGVVLGWWVKGMFVSLKLEDNKNKNVSDHRNLRDAREQLSLLQAKYDQAQDKIDRYTEHYNSNTYGKYLEVRKSLEDARKEHEELLAELNHQKNTVRKLRYQIEQDRKIADSQHYLNDLSNTLKKSPAFSDEESEIFNDDLKKISGISEDLEKQLNSLGIMKYRQIAEFSVQDAEMISGHLDSQNLPEYQSMVAMAKDLYVNKHTHQAA